MRPLLAVLLFCVSACTAPPTLPPRPSSGIAPDLAPITPLLSAAGQQGQRAPTTAPDSARQARLKARAAALRGPVLATGTRNRLNRGATGAAALQ